MMYNELDKFLEEWKRSLLSWYEDMKSEWHKTPSSKKMKAKFPDLTKTDLLLISERPVYKNDFLSKSIEEILEDDFKRKRNRLVSKINSKLTGEIDLVRLYSQSDGNLNGFIRDVNGNTVQVETILAGGYNIQKLHYRVLVK